MVLLLLKGKDKMGIDELKEIFELMKRTALEKFIPGDELSRDRIEGKFPTKNPGVSIIISTLIGEPSTGVFLEEAGNRVLLAYLDTPVREVSHIESILDNVALMQESFSKRTLLSKAEAVELLSRPGGMGLHSQLEDEEKACRIKWILYFYEEAGYCLHSKHRSIGNDWGYCTDTPVNFDGYLFRLV